MVYVGRVVFKVFARLNATARQTYCCRENGERKNVYRSFRALHRPLEDERDSLDHTLRVDVISCFVEVPPQMLAPIQQVSDKGTRTGKRLKYLEWLDVQQGLCQGLIVMLSPLYPEVQQGCGHPSGRRIRSHEDDDPCIVSRSTQDITKIMPVVVKSRFTTLLAASVLR